MPSRICIETSFIYSEINFQYEGKVDCMAGLGITESFSVKRQVLVQASEAAEMILRVDDILKAAPRPRKEDRGHC